MGRDDHPSVDASSRPVASGRAGGDGRSMHRELRERIEAGTYCVDSTLVAEAMIIRMRRERASAVFVPPQATDLDAAGPEQGDAGALGDSA